MRPRVDRIEPGRASRSVRPTSRSARVGVAGAPPARLFPVVVAEIALLAVALTASLGVARLIQDGLGKGVAVPMVVTVLGAGAVTLVAARTRLPTPLVALMGAVAACLCATWTVVPSATRDGLPTATTYHVVLGVIDTARSVMGSHRTPVPAVTGVVLIACVSSGAVCVAGRLLWEVSRRSKRRSPQLLALVPALGMLCYSAPLSARIDRPQTALAFLASGMVFVAASDASGRVLRPTGPRDRVVGAFSTLVAPMATSLAALLAVVLAAGALSGAVPLPFPWWGHTSGKGSAAGSAGGSGQGQNPPDSTALSLIANLRSEETTSASVQMFQATSPDSTYWQVGTLSVFDGTKWIPGSDEQQALAGDGVYSPPAPYLSYNGPLETATITIQNFSGRLLPTPPITQQMVSNSAQLATYFDGLGLAEAATSTAGETYTVSFAPNTVPEPTSGPRDLAAIYSALGPARSEYLSLPRGIPKEVLSIARSAVKGAETPVEEVRDLVDYFRGNGFVYTLSPPTIPAGENPLLAFLVTYRKGFCQQYAGAFGVMARELGLPVRLAVGFTAGQPLPGRGDVYEVTGADSHVWPEVYLGSALGWVSVDPTPGNGGTPAKSGVEGSTGRTKTGSSRARSVKPTRKPTSVPAKTGLRTHSRNSASLGGGGKTPTPVPTPAQAPGLPTGWVLLGVLAAAGLGAGTGLVIWTRRVRPALMRGETSLRHSSDPDHVVLRAWSRASGALGRAGFLRSQWSTPVAHAAEVHGAVVDVGRSDTARSPSDSVAAAWSVTHEYTELCELAELACYCPGRCTDSDARRAEQEAWRIEHAMRQMGLIRRFPLVAARPRLRARL
jgi:transglutaminase-like putative cysteine protease